MKDLNISILFTFLLLGIYACDHLENDVTPDNDEILNFQNEVYTFPNTAVVLDIKEYLKLNEGGEVAVETLPKKGTLNLTDQGFARYTPDESFTSGMDLFVFRVANNSGAVIDKDSISIVVVTDTTDIPCFNGALTDYANTLINTPIQINLIKNDGYCKGFEASIKIKQQPANGALELTYDSLSLIEPFTYQYTPNKDFAGIDSALYELKVIDSEGETHVSVAYVIIEVSECTAFQLNDDTLVLPVDSTNQIEIYPLKNDSICLGQEYEFEVIEGPNFGAVEYGSIENPDNFKIYYYTNATNFPVTDTFKYRLTDGNENSREAVVSVIIKSKDTCNLVDANDDYYRFNIDTLAMDSLSLNLYVLDNDEMCDSDEAINLKLISNGTFGVASVQQQHINYTINDPITAPAIDTLRYEVCKGNACDTALVNIDLK